MESKYSGSKLKQISPLLHHQRQQLCQTRLPYRRGKKPTAVKVFTIADESQYLLIQNVPILSGVDVKNDLHRLCSQYGRIIRLEAVDYEHRETFTQTYLVRFETMVEAIRAKKRLDDHELLGNCLHVCYSPEQETMEETMDKIKTRQRYVGIKLAQQCNLLEQQKKKKNLG